MATLLVNEIAVKLFDVLAVDLFVTRNSYASVYLGIVFVAKINPSYQPRHR